MPKKLTTDEFIQIAIDKHGDKYDYSKVDYINNRTKVIIICKEHNEFEQIPASHLYGIGCSKCGKSYNFTTDEYIERARKKHGNKYDYSKVNYINCSSNIIIICKKHGEFKQNAKHHLNGSNCPKCVQKHSYTTSEFIEKANKIHNNKYDYSLTEYTKSHEKVKIKCKEHGVFEQTPSSHFKSNGCSKCSGKYNYNTKDFIEKANKIHNNKYDYSLTEYTKSHEKVKIKCKEHGVFEKCPSYHLKGQGCPICSRIIQINENQRKYYKQFILEAKKIHGDKYDYSKVVYINNSEKIKIICRDHGEFIQQPYHHLSGCGCQKCAGCHNHSTKEFIDKLKNIHGDKYDYSKVDYINSKNRITIICRKHGDFDQAPYSHLSGNECPKCTLQTSKPAQQWIDYLSITKPDIQHFYSENGEFSIPNSRYKADGYDEKTNTIYEFHGDFWHGNPKLFNQDELNKITKTTFGELFEKTISKEEFCKSKGYKYISLWENDWKKGVNAVRKIQKKFKEFYIS
jgi:hypothetical protein